MPPKKPEGSDGLLILCYSFLCSRIQKLWGGNNNHSCPFRGLWKHKNEWALGKYKVIFICKSCWSVLFCSMGAVL